MVARVQEGPLHTSLEQLSPAAASATENDKAGRTCEQHVLAQQSGAARRAGRRLAVITPIVLVMRIVLIVLIVLNTLVATLALVSPINTTFVWVVLLALIMLLVPLKLDVLSVQTVLIMMFLFVGF